MKESPDKTNQPTKLITLPPEGELRGEIFTADPIVTL